MEDKEELNLLSTPIASMTKRGFLPRSRCFLHEIEFYKQMIPHLSDRRFLLMLDGTGQDFVTRLSAC
jgi:hypothetical protein